MSLDKMGMRLAMGICVFVFLITLVAANSSYVEVHEGIGSGTQDVNQYEDIPDEEENDEENDEEEEEQDQSHHTRKLKNSGTFHDRVKIEQETIVVTPTELSLIGEDTNVSDTAKEPIDWKPIITWGLIIAGAMIVIWIAWVIYQIYYY